MDAENEPETIAVPPATSTMVTAVLCRDSSGEGYSTLGIDPVAISAAPAGESFRVDI